MTIRSVLPQLAAATPAAFTGLCENLVASLAGLGNTTITAATTVAAGTLTVGGQPVAEHCQVTGRMFERVSAVDSNSYAIGFEMRLPKAWNGRFFHQGNGGIDGNVVTATGSFGGGPLTHALQQGFAVLSSDAGHAAALGPAFGIDPQARLDYGYQAVGKLTPMAKEAIRRVYTKAPDRSYFGGCSNGGRHTFVAAARYPADYDGYLAGAPGYNLPLAAIANIFGAQRYATVATNAGRPVDGVHCRRAHDGGERGARQMRRARWRDRRPGAGHVGVPGGIQPRQRRADLHRRARRHLPQSAAQKTAIAPIFSGATTSTGTKFYASFPYDSGLGANGIAFWEFTAPLVLDSGAVGIIFKVPPENPAGFNGPAFALSASIDTLLAQDHATDATYTESAHELHDAAEPDRPVAR